MLDELLNTAPLVEHTNSVPNAPVYVPANQMAQLYQHFGITPYWDQRTRRARPVRQYCQRSRSERRKLPATAIPR